jgi:hypothetical protein
LPNPNFRNQEFFVKNQYLTRSFFLENQEIFAKESEDNQKIFLQNPEENEMYFWNQVNAESSVQFSPTEVNMSLLQILVSCLYQASNENNYRISEKKQNR